ncbi:MAG: ribonuclease HII [Cyanobacteriota bacterium]|nr:ribonuclease HII [Cyanobacteriota bacterium]
MAKSSPFPTLDREHVLWSQGIQRLAALDEVGRGAWAGCVAVAALLFAPDLDPEQLRGVHDSKQLTRRQREQLLPAIQACVVRFALGTATPQEIDRLNIRRATALAMQRALRQLGEVDHVLLDGLPMPELTIPQTAVVKGDAQCLSIAAASVVAKVNRDAWMRCLDRRYPGYGWSTNVGYGTAEHRRALQELGLTRHHRRRFVPLADLGLA